MGELLEVGAHRKPEVVIAGVANFERLAPPNRIINTLLTHLAVSTAHLYFHGSGSGSGGTFHPGDAFGRVLAWLWSTGQEAKAVELVANLTGELREHNPHAEPPRLAFTRILSGIELSLPHDFTDSQRGALRARLGADVLGWFGQSIEAP